MEEKSKNLKTVANIVHMSMFAYVAHCICPVPLCVILKKRNKLKEIIRVIDEIAKYGLNTNLNFENKESDLEENLIKIYSFSFNIEYKFEDKEYPDFKKERLPNVIENVRSNFPEFGFYHQVVNCHKLDKNPDNVIGDAIDDLSDVIFDLLEIKWRKENNSEQDALWFFDLIFRSHTKHHVLNLLNFIGSKNG